MGYAFISYSSADLDKANAVRDLFLSQNIDCWMAKYDIQQNFPKELGQKIRSCSCFVLLLTDSAQKSKWVSKEVALSIKYDKEILPVQLEKGFELNDAFSAYLADVHIEPVDEINEKDFGINRVLQKVISFAGIKESEKKQQKEKVAEKKQAEKEEASDIVTVVEKYGWKYVGQMKDGKYHGKGTYYWSDGSIWYDGDWFDGIWHGKGTMFNSDGSILYDGEWVNGKQHGKGTYYWENGDRYTGEWKNGVRNGWGTYYYADGRTEEKYYVNNILKLVDGEPV